jgi:eukaryotic-like serine/threonine-protein kinase
MSRPAHPPPLVRFGNFELDLISGELFCEGRKLPLPPKAFAVLKALVERPGEVVTREELRSKLWAADTFVEFEDSLNHAVNKLRRVLGDSAEKPQFIETLPRSGYRFIAPDVGPKLSEQAGPPVVAPFKANTSLDLPRAVRRMRVAFSWAAVILVGAMAGTFVYKYRTQALTEKDTVVLADFANQTDDPVFTDTLRQGLLVAMSQSPFFNFLPTNKVNATLRHMGHNVQDPLNDDLARQVCQRNQGKAFIAGSIASLGTQYVLSLRAVNCFTGDLLVQQQTQIARKEDVIRALSQQATTLRRKLGESLGSIQKFDVPLEQATTSSLEALQAYTIAGRQMAQFDSQSAIVPLKRAIALDPDFSMAYLRLAAVYGNLDQTGLMEENTRKAFALRSRSTEGEGLRIEAAYHLLANGDLYQALEVYKLVKNLYPRVAFPYNLTGIIYRDSGQYEKALLEDQEFDRRSPSVISITNMVGDLICLGQLDQAQKLLAESETRRVSRQALLPLYYSLAFFRHDSQQMEEIANSASGDPGIDRQLLAMRSDTAAYYGRFKQSRQFRQQAVEACLSHGLVESTAAHLSAAALQESDVGNFKEAQQLAAKSLNLARTRVVLAGAGMAYGQSGGASQAQALADELGRRYPFHTLANLSWIPSIRADIDNRQGDAPSAVEALQKATPVELGNANGEMDDGLTLRPVYARGQAFLLLHRGAEAASEFRKIVDHPGYIGPNTVTVLAQLGLARAYVLQGDAAKARAEYEQFLNLWKDADPDLLVLQQAKEEYANLQ